MEERVLFHLRQSSPGKDHVDGDSPTVGSKDSSSAVTTDSGRALVCTCIHSSSASTFAVGFKHGLVHVYRRVPSGGDVKDDDCRHHCEDGIWRRSIVEPTKALNSGKSGPQAAAASLPPDITCLAVSPIDDMMAVGTSDGYVFVMPTPALPCAAGGDGSGGDSDRTYRKGGGVFHHKSHGGRRVNCILWDSGGDRLFSVCHGGTVIMARNLRPRRKAPTSELPGMTGVMSLLGIQQLAEARLASNAPPVPQAVIIGQTGSPGLQLDLGRTHTFLAAVGQGQRVRSCDVLLVMTRKQAVLLYLAVGQDLSIVAPYQTSVDLNVLEHLANGSGGGTSDSGGLSTSPPSRSDLGACLWGPPRAAVGGDLVSLWDRNGEHQRGGLEGGGALAGLPVGEFAPREVNFLYVAQPGGRLWRVDLSDGEVESTHRPSGMVKQGAENKGSKGRGQGNEDTAASSGFGESFEFGQLWAVNMGDLLSQFILCWRTVQDPYSSSSRSTEFALLDPKTHRFVASCPALASVVDLSGSFLAPSIKPPSIWAAIRVLHDEHPPKVSQLCLAVESHRSGRDGDGTSAGGSDYLQRLNDAAVRMQRIWRAKKERQGSLSPPDPAPPSPSQHGAVVGGPDLATSPRNMAMVDDTSEEDVGVEDSPTHSARRKRERSKKRREEASPRENFSIRESLDALDAADRALQNKVDVEQRAFQGEVPQDSEIGLDVGVDLPGNSGELLDLGSRNARALMRDTDDLIRQTLPVLHRSRSFDPVVSPSGSLHAMDATEMSSSVPARWEETKDGGSRAAAMMSLAGAETDRSSIERVVSGHRGVPEEDRVAWTTAGTSQGRSSFPPDTGSTGLGTEGQQKPRSRSLGGFEEDGSPLEFPAVDTTIPFPRGHASDDISRRDASDIQGTPEEQRSRSRTWALDRDGHISTLFGPVQSMWGVLLQRSVQAVNDALQPGGGAASDDSSSDDRGDEAFARQESKQESCSQDGGVDGANSSRGSGTGTDIGIFQEVGEADGGTTSDTGKKTWDVSSESCGNSMHSTTKPSHDTELTNDRFPVSSPTGETRRIDDQVKKKRRRGEKKMLFESGMLGIKRKSLVKLRSRRESRVSSSPAVVMDLPSSAMDDPTPFVTPSQYQVRLNRSKGLGLSLNITGNDVRVKGFPLLPGGEIGPAQACGQIQIGDALVCVNHDQLTLLNHDSVVRVLRGLLSINADQLVLMRFLYAEDSPTPSLLSTSFVPIPPAAMKHQSSAEASEVMRGGGFRSESWHGSRNAGGTQRQQREHLKIESRRSHSQGDSAEDSPTLGSGMDETDGTDGTDGDMTDGVEGVGGIDVDQTGGWSDKRKRTLGTAAASQGLGSDASGVEGDAIVRQASAFGGGQKSRGRDKIRLERLWGESDKGIGKGGGVNRHVYLGDMGLAQAQKTLSDIAQDVQHLHRIIHSAEEVRFHRGRDNPNLSDPSSTSVESRTSPPSAMLAALSPSSRRSLPFGGVGTADGKLGSAESPPPLPKELYRGRRRRRPRRRRSSLRFPGLYGAAGEPGVGALGVSAGRAIDLPTCREVIRGELGRLEKDLQQQEEMLARRNRWSNVRGLVLKLVRSSNRSGVPHRPPLSPLSPTCSPNTRASNSNITAMKERHNTSLRARGTPWVDVSDGYWSDGLSDSDGSTSSTALEGRGRGRRRVTSDGLSNLLGVDLARRDETDTACDIFLEAVSTESMQDEFLQTLSLEVLRVDPPRPLPAAAYDLQTALESVQHLATQTLSAVVQAEAVRGRTQEFFASGLSPRGMGGGHRAAKEAKEAAAAGGLRDGWELWWPPRELTASLALVTARQMANAMRCDAEPLIQIWMRCFTPLGVKHRERLWGALAPSPLDSLEVFHGRWHRQLVCGLVTLFAQVHISWPFLGRPSDDPGLNSLKLKTCWLSAHDSASNQQGGEGPSVHDWPTEDDGDDDIDVQFVEDAADRNGISAPHQWDEDKTVEFIQDYGCYLEADALAAAVSCREMEWPLREVFRLAEQSGDFRARERILHQLLRGVRTPLPLSPTASSVSPLLRSPVSTPGNRTPTVLSPRSPAFRDKRVSPLAVNAALMTQAQSPGVVEEEAVRRALGLPSRSVDASAVRPGRDFPSERVSPQRTEGERGSETDDPLGSSPLCLLLKNLGELFKWDTAAAADICADAFPGVRPWNVHCALHQEQGEVWSSVELPTPRLEGAGANISTNTGTSTKAKIDTTANTSSKYSMGDDSATRNDAVFQTYLWAMMEKHPTVCRKDWKMVQRCLQLSLRLSTKLRSKSPDHPLVGFCKSATRSVKCRRRTNYGPSEVVQTEDSPLERGQSSANPGTSRLSQRSANVTSRKRYPVGDGVNDDDAVWRLYSDMVQHVICAWCRDKGAYDLDPLWLLTKLRSHRDWSVAFQVCAAEARSWEHHASSHGSLADPAGCLRLSRAMFSSIGTVFDTLADACFASFEEADTKTLAVAIAAIWSADGAIRRACGRSLGEAVRALEVTGQNGQEATQSPREEVDEVDIAVESGDEGKDDSRPAREGSRSTRSNSGDWLAGSKMLDIVRRLTPRCEGLRIQYRDEGTASMVAGGVDTRAVTEVSPLELAKTILDGVGPETTISVMEACPQLLDNLPPKFFHALADRQAALLQEQALETELLKQATTAVWAARGRASGYSYGARGATGDSRRKKSTPAASGYWLDDRAKLSPLGTRLAWLALEELTSFFPQDRDKLSLPYLSDSKDTSDTSDLPAGATAETEGVASYEEEHLTQAVNRSGVNLLLPKSTHRGVSLRPYSPCLLCGIPLAGTACSISVTSPAGRGVAGFRGSSGGVTRGEGGVIPPGGEDLQVVVEACGHGFHVACMEEGLEGAGAKGWREAWWDANDWGGFGGGGVCWACGGDAL